VPAYFNDSQRQATKDAGEIAGLKVERIINEPTAAALAYGLDKKKNEKIAVFDLGGGTFDVSILDIGDGVFEVLSTNGDTHLGGDDFDQVLINYLADEFRKKEGIDLRKDAMALQRLKEAAEKGQVRAVHQRRRRRSTCRSSPPTPRGPSTCRSRSPAASSSSAGERPVRALREPVPAGDQGRQAQRPKTIDEVVLVGGSTRMPEGAAIVKEIFGKEPNKSVNPDEVVAIGAAIQGGVLQGERQGHPAAGRHAAVAGRRDARRRDDQAHRAQHDHPDQQEGGLLDRRDNQTEVTIHVLQGEREIADNRTLGSSSSRHPAGAARHAADRGRVRHRRQRHPDSRPRAGPRAGTRRPGPRAARTAPRGATTT
jgi:molecular chaperone DnaK